ncbi:MAG: leucyl aminopeptidase [Magnetococcales bacterium]|nr:leucyl aminopeptidase [Magnetococcales bacterium]MBF0438687.1 leucyl aminopeptidase [Magnetococcales bacterium]
MSETPLKMDGIAVDVATWDADVLVIGVYQGGEPQAAISLCGEEVAQEIRQILKAGWMRGELGEMVFLPVARQNGLRISRLLLAGMGKRESLSLESFRALGASVVKACEKSSVENAICLLALDKHNGFKHWQILETMAEGAWLGKYRYDCLQSVGKKDSPRHSMKKLWFAVQEERVARCRKLFEKVEIITKGVMLARDLGNTPGNLLTPEVLARKARELAEQWPIKTTIHSGKSLEQKGMNGILAVGQGSANPPCLIVMEYRKGGDRPVLAVVGKAVTFDSGGISLKPGAKMEEMKFDMSGGAAVFGFMQAIAEMKLPINVVGIVPSAENLPSGTAQRPGDVIKMASGLFVEVINTDAEGRLILADALHHAASFDPDVIIDLATLTGACVIALGAHASAVLGNDDILRDQLCQAGERSGERLWPMPIFQEYQEQIKSVVADIKNVGGREAGTITAACFLSRFVDEGRAWAHIDIAGTAMDLTGSRPHVPKGSVGIGVRLLCRYALKERM